MSASIAKLHAAVHLAIDALEHIALQEAHPACKMSHEGPDCLSAKQPGPDCLCAKLWADQALLQIAETVGVMQ